MSSIYRKNQHFDLDEIILNEGFGHSWFSGGHHWKIDYNSKYNLSRLGYKDIEPYDPYLTQYRILFHCKCGAKKIVTRIMAG